MVYLCPHLLTWAKYTTPSGILLLLEGSSTCFSSRDGYRQDAAHPQPVPISKPRDLHCLLHG